MPVHSSGDLQLLGLELGLILCLDLDIKPVATLTIGYWVFLVSFLLYWILLCLLVILSFIVVFAFLLSICFLALHIVLLILFIHSRLELVQIVEHLIILSVELLVILTNFFSVA